MSTRALPPRRHTRTAATQPRQGQARECDLWAQRPRLIGSPPPQGRWAVVADRGADIYAHLYQCQQQGLGFVGRAAQDWDLAAAGESTTTLFVVARTKPSMHLRYLVEGVKPAEHLPREDD